MRDYERCDTHLFIQLGIRIISLPRIKYVKEINKGKQNANYSYPKKIISLSILILALLLIGGFLHSYLQKDVQTIQPIYIGNTTEKAVAFMVNVDWERSLSRIY